MILWRYFAILMHQFSQISHRSRRVEPVAFFASGLLRCGVVIRIDFIVRVLNFPWSSLLTYHNDIHAGQLNDIFGGDFRYVWNFRAFGGCWFAIAQKAVINAWKADAFYCEVITLACNSCCFYKSGAPKKRYLASRRELVSSLDAA